MSCNHWCDCVAQGQHAEHFSQICHLVSEQQSAQQDIVFSPGQVVFYRGHKPRGVFVVRQGAVACNGSVFLPTQHTQQHLVLGLFHLIDDTPHCLSAVARSPVRVGFVPKIEVLNLLDHYLRKNLLLDYKKQT